MKKNMESMPQCSYNKEEIRVIGVDAGGTKTRAAAYSANGVLIAEATEGCGNVALSYNAGKTAITAAIRAVWSENCRYVAVGAAGAASSGTAARLAAELTDTFGGTKTDVMSDAELALNAAFGPSGDGMLIISGTGSVVFLRHSGTLLRAGGWGHLLGDGGSAYFTGMTALRLITALRDRGEPDERLENTVFGALGLDGISDLVNYVYAPERTKADFARIAPVLDDLAENGHPAAAEILQKSADALADDAAALLRRSGAAAVDIALTGGHITHSAVLRRNLEQTLRAKAGSACRLTFLPDAPDPTYAAYRMYSNVSSTGRAFPKKPT
ncbi:MAG: N-acetylglucosamine kinase [Eubacteriales bacterium]